MLDGAIPSGHDSVRVRDRSTVTHRATLRAYTHHVTDVHPVFGIIYYSFKINLALVINYSIQVSTNFVYAMFYDSDSVCH